MQKNHEKIIFKVVKIKFLSMHITNKKLSFDIFTVRNIFMEHDLNPLRIQCTPSGDRVKSSDTKKKKTVGHVIYPRKAEILVISTM